jgi:dienelactone hydrolase
MVWKGSRCAGIIIQLIQLCNVFEIYRRTASARHFRRRGISTSINGSALRQGRRTEAWMRKHRGSLFLGVLVAALGFAGLAKSGERVVDLTAADGTKLKATFFAAAKPGPGVLLLHQCNGDRKGWDGLAQQLSAAGINVLTVDNRGFGESGGTPRDKNTPQQEGQIEKEKWPGDFDTAYEYLTSQPGVMKGAIGAGGASCGLDNAVQVARRHPEVKALMLLSGTTNPGGREFLRSATKLPVFLSLADDDEFKPSVPSTEWLYFLNGDPEKRLVHLANGGHGAEMFKPHPELMTAIVDWFVTTLIKTPGHSPVPKEPPVLLREVRYLEEIDTGGTAKVAKGLEEARRKDPKAQLFPEDLVNFMGYEHLKPGDNKDAIEILKLNAEAYPDSPNVYDSLSDAYLADDQKGLARKNAEKALALLPSDTTDPEDRRIAIKDSAEGKLKELGPGA